MDLDGAWVPLERKEICTKGEEWASRWEESLSVRCCPRGNRERENGSLIPALPASAFAVQVRFSDQSMALAMLGNTVVVAVSA